MISKIADQITLISEADQGFDLFEARYPIPEGITYNTYVREDEKTVLLDAVDAKVTDEWVSDLKKVLNGRKLDYFVVHHMEPDHSANIGTVLSMFPDVRIITSAKAVKSQIDVCRPPRRSYADVAGVTDLITPWISRTASPSGRMRNVPSRWNSRNSWRVATAPASETSLSFRNVGTATDRTSAGADERQL